MREAFLTLLAEGLLNVMPQKGTFVSLLERETLRDALFVREALECAAARLAASAPLLQRKSLLRIVDRQREALRHDDAEGALQADEDLHRAIMNLSGHASAWEVVRQARTHLDRLRRLASRELKGSEEASPTINKLPRRSSTATSARRSSCCETTSCRLRGSSTAWRRFTLTTSSSGKKKTSGARPLDSSSVSTPRPRYP